MFDKKSLNPIRERGFDSKAQMRYLLMMMREHPDQYGWVKDVIRNHGVPSTEGPLRTYWEPPYNKSPKKPSYVYTGRASLINKIVRFASQLPHHQAQQLLRPLYVDESTANEVANMFWTIRGNELNKQDPEQLLAFFHKLQEFKPFASLNSETQEETKRILGDKILGRA
jgi:hypothetical protein